MTPGQIRSAASKKAWRSRKRMAAACKVKTVSQTTLPLEASALAVRLSPGLRSEILLKRFAS